jgi:hypothetical protein
MWRMWRMCGLRRTEGSLSGKPRYLLNHRWRVSRQLDHWLAKITEATQRQSANEEQPRGEFADYVRALQRIALGQEPTGTARDRLTALKELLKLERKGTTSFIEGTTAADPELHKRWAAIEHAQTLERVKSLESKHHISQ